LSNPGVGDLGATARGFKLDPSSLTPHSPASQERPLAWRSVYPTCAVTSSSLASTGLREVEGAFDAGALAVGVHRRLAGERDLAGRRRAGFARPLCMRARARLSKNKNQRGAYHRIAGRAVDADRRSDRRLHPERRKAPRCEETPGLPRLSRSDQRHRRRAGGFAGAVGRCKAAPTRSTVSAPASSSRSGGGSR